MCFKAPPSVYWNRDDDEDVSESSSGSCLSEVYSLPEFLPTDTESPLQLIESPGNMPLGDSWRLQQKHKLESMQHMEQWLTMQLQRRSLAISQQVILRPNRLTEPDAMVPRALEYKQTASDTRALSYDGSGTLNRRPASSFLQPPTKPLLLLQAPVFLTETLNIGLYCERGSRSTNEDMAFGMMLPTDPSSSHASRFQQAVCCGVFDGHGGVEVAAHLTERLPELILRRRHQIQQEGVKEASLFHVHSHVIYFFHYLLLTMSTHVLPISLPLSCEFVRRTCFLGTILSGNPRVETQAARHWF